MRTMIIQNIVLIHPERPPTDCVFNRSKLFMNIHVHNFPQVSIWVFKSVYFKIEETFGHLKDISTLRCSLDLTSSLLCRTRECMEPKQELQMALEPFEIQAKQVEAGEVVAKVQDGIKFKWSANRVMVMTDQGLLRKTDRISWPQPELMKFLSCMNLQDSSFHRQNYSESRAGFAIFPSKGSSKVKTDHRSAKVCAHFQANLPCN